jgi:hypothetical protein
MGSRHAQPAGVDLAVGLPHRAVLYIRALKRDLMVSGRAYATRIRATAPRLK